MFICMFDRMVDPNNYILENDLQRNDEESIPAHSVNQNSMIPILQRSKKAISALLNPENVENQKELLDNLEPEMMAKIVVEVTRKLQCLGFETDQKENKFFD